MTFKRKLQNFLLLILVVYANVTTLIGLTPFYYSRKKRMFVENKWLSFYCWLMSWIFFIFYPVSFLYLLPDFHTDYTSVTDYAKNSTYIFNFVFCLIIYFLQLNSASECRDVLNRAIVIFQEIAATQTDEHLSFNVKIISKCVLRTLLPIIGFFLINIQKYNHRIEPNISAMEFFLMFYLFLPNLIISFSSNRFYVAMTFSLYLLSKNNDQIEAIEEGCKGIQSMGKISVYKLRLYRTVTHSVNIVTKNYASLHQIFIDFNKVYSQNILMILGFCFMNIVYELYFLYLNFLTSMINKSPLNPFFAIMASSQAFLFYIEIFTLIYIYNKLKNVATKCGSIIHRIPVLKSDGTLTRQVNKSIILLYLLNVYLLVGFIKNKSQ